jgi:predicted nuclease of predicted toxin-antitoxin system
LKILLDEMMPERFSESLKGHAVRHVVNLGWRHITNGKLLDIAEASGYDVFVTKDSNIPYQQNLVGRKIAIVVLRPATQDFLDLEALAPKILSNFPGILPGSVTVVTP